ncbi:MAG: hypothetical protein U9R57_13900, partial [Thermodesulfobacteriota bacterium]|nr:hypothetical protein [Thermodesulfobacteriota bacterium]
PITLLLQNALMPSFFQASHDDNVSTPPSNLVSKNKNHSWGTLEQKLLFRQIRHVSKTFSLKNEIEFIRWRMKRSSSNHS